MATYKNTDKIISHLNDEIEACGNPDSDNEPIAYGTKLGLLSAKAFIETAETADVQDVRHGKWIRSSHNIVCSVCGRKRPFKKTKPTAYCEKGYCIAFNSRYCPHCGAKMCGDEAEAKLKELEGKI